MVWGFVPKNLFSSIANVKIVAYITASIFNIGFSSILLIVINMNVTIWSIAAAICDTLNEERIQIANKRLRTPKEIELPVNPFDRHCKRLKSKQGAICTKQEYLIAGK